MKITVTTTSTSLEALLVNEVNRISSVANTYDRLVSIQNLGTVDIYLESFWAAAVATWFKIIAWNQADVHVNNMEQLFLIADTTPNTDVRVIIT